MSGAANRIFELVRASHNTGSDNELMNAVKVKITWGGWSARKGSVLTLDTGTTANPPRLAPAVKTILRLCAFTFLLLAPFPATAFFDHHIGRWASRDPIGEIQRPKTRAESLYSFCGNDGVDYWDYLGLWLGSDHQSLTSKSFSSAWNGLGDTSPCSGKKLLSVISDANVATDKQPDASDLKQHYNRAFWGTDPGETARNAYVSHVQRVVAGYSKLLEAKSDRAKCVEALRKLGRVSHSWQDYYAHAIGLNSPYWGDPGPIEGNPDSPSASLKPASWGGNNNWGEHGPSEPARVLEIQNM